ncbi:hypothetical protein [uncultured Caulobacter sp.]|uniref:hypothetical protein n=1 Tax=uncultured Caulobacter sp. TaxID=158749 RepID=UPI002639808A|nr:hypothetical protein [uncultured Caulobacter sp.]
MSKHNSHLRAAFDAAFVFPFAAYVWQSERARSCWIDLEGWQDNLAGPVSHIVEHGDCAYVYRRNDAYFTGVDDPAALHARLQSWHGEMVAGLKRFVPTSEAEANDLAAMRQFADEIWAVTEQAIEVERTRWERATV